MALKIGSIVSGKVASIMPFGAFVSLPEKKSGLVHISEIASGYVENVKDYLKVGDEVSVKILDIDDSGKISLSIKKANTAEKAEKKPAGKVRPADIDWGAKSDSELSFEDKLSKFKKDADEKMLALKRSNESKRSGGYHRGGSSY